MEYYRFTNKNTPMSDWGHAMFATNRNSVCNGYGHNEYHYNGKQAVAIQSLYDAIATEWEESKEFGAIPDCYENLSTNQVCETFNPDDIVQDAEAWDDPDMYRWFCENILDKYGVVAVTTEDGAIIFDENLATLI